MTRTTRRHFLAAGATAAAATAVAGCSVSFGNSGGLAAGAPDGGGELWTADLGGVDAGQRNGTVHALARDDGTERWVYEGDDGVRDRPVVTDEAVVVETE